MVVIGQYLSSMGTHRWCGRESSFFNSETGIHSQHIVYNSTATGVPNPHMNHDKVLHMVTYRARRTTYQPILVIDPLHHETRRLYNLEHHAQSD
jgi:hypothetical protein